MAMEQGRLKFESTIDRLAESHGRAHITIDAGVHGSRVQISHAELLDYGMRAATRLTEAGCEPGDRIAIALPTSLPLLASIVGCWCAGFIPVILPTAVGKGESGAALQRNILRTIKAGAVVGTGIPGEAIADVDREGVTFLAGGDLIRVSGPVCNTLHRAHPNDISLLQFSSGSTGTPRACVIRHGQMANNLLAIMDRARGKNFTAVDERLLSWTPLNHDMGFNTLPLSLLAGIDLVLLPTESFSRAPHLWLQRISETRATMSPAPPFAYRLLTQIQHARQLRDIDLSGWRCAWMGAEPVYPDHVENFISAFSDRGLDSTAMRPNYGLAETVIVSTMLPPNEEVSIIPLDKECLLRTGVVRKTTGAEAALSLVGCGYPLDGVEIAIADHVGSLHGEDQHGRILVRGHGVIDRYWNETTCLDQNGWLDTGDIGFFHKRQIFISGRSKDINIRGGKNYAANDIEWVIETYGAEFIKRSAVFSVLYGTRKGEEVVAVVEVKRRYDDTSGFERALRETVSSNLGLSIDKVVTVPPGTIPRTTSGKIQRGAARDIYLSGLLDSITT